MVLSGLFILKVLIELSTGTFNQHLYLECLKLKHPMPSFTYYFYLEGVIKDSNLEP